MFRNPSLDQIMVYQSIYRYIQTDPNCLLVNIYFMLQPANTLGVLENIYILFVVEMDYSADQYLEINRFDVDMIYPSISTSFDVAMILYVDRSLDQSLDLSRYLSHIDQSLH